MASYLLRKLLLAVPLVLSVVLLIFGLLELSPGDYCDAFFSPDLDPKVLAQMRAAFDCDASAPERFLKLLGNLARLDLGESSTYSMPVSAVIRDYLPNTLLLSLVTIVVAQVTGGIVGVVQAVRHRGPADTALSVATLVLYSMPQFWLGLVLLITLTPALPVSGMVDGVMHDFMSPAQKGADVLLHLVLPGVAMGIAAAAADARYMRSAMLDALSQDYIRTARAKGLRERTVVLGHALRNALLPMVTLLGLNLPALFSGSVVVENVFGWPGMGRVIVAAIARQDGTLVIGCFLVFSVLVVVGGLLADVLYAVADPRIRYR